MHKINIQIERISISIVPTDELPELQKSQEHLDDLKFLSHVRMLREIFVLAKTVGQWERHLLRDEDRQ